MTRLAFLSPDNAAPGVALVSPLQHALGEGVADVSHLGKLELRGPRDAVEPGPGEELLPLSPTRALLVTDGSPARARERLHGDGLRVYDMTAAYTGLSLPAVSSCSRSGHEVVDGQAAPEVSGTTTTGQAACCTTYELVLPSHTRCMAPS